MTHIARLAHVAALVVVAATVLKSSAHGQTVVTREPFSTFLFNQCAAGELIEITGTSLLVSRSVEFEHFLFRFVVAGAKGIAPATGANYVVVIQDGRTLSVLEADGTVWTVVQHLRFVRLGEDGLFQIGDDFDLMIVFHITTTPDGTTRVEIDRSDLTCR